MKYYTPDYYSDFCCIADKCKHSCCLGWEIDVDSDTYEYYMSVEGKIGEKLRDKISHGDNPQFILDKNERCPFLRSDKLCELIIELGEDSLCDICTDHPRFRNYYSARIEIGLGICCEAAARLILANPDKTAIVLFETDGDCTIEQEEEKRFFDFRQGIFDILQDRTKSIEQRTEKMLSACGAVVPEKPFSEWANIYKSLERLDNSWEVYLDSLYEYDGKISDVFSDIKWQNCFEQLLVYFVFRHFTDAFDNSELPQAAALCVLSYRIIYSLCEVHLRRHGNISFEVFAEISRLYSSEVEYSDEAEAVLYKALGY